MLTMAMLILLKEKGRISDQAFLVILAPAKGTSINDVIIILGIF